MEPSVNLDLVKIRPGRESDCPTLMKLIKDLAIYEKMPDDVKTSVEDLKRYAFHTTPPVLYFLVGELPSMTASSGTGTDDSEEDNKRIVGYATYYKTYSAWKGKALHLEDFFVRQEHRHKGLGGRFLKELGKIALNEDYAKISFEVIDWNEPSIKFYKRYGAVDVTVTEFWDNYRFSYDALKKLAE